MVNGLNSSLYIACLTKSLKIGSAARAPVSYLPSVFGLSKPIYTPTTRLDVTPINHASKLSLVVPVLPARGTFKSLSFFPVPL